MGLLLAGSYCRVDASHRTLTTDSMYNRLEILQSYLNYGGKNYQRLSHLNSKPSSSVIVKYIMFAGKRMHIDRARSKAVWSFIMSSMSYVATSRTCAQLAILSKWTNGKS